MRRVGVRTRCLHGLPFVQAGLDTWVPPSVKITALGVRTSTRDAEEQVI